MQRKSINLKVSNKQFDSLPKNEQRIQIAKDVLLRIKANQLVGEEGEFMQVKSYNREKYSLSKNSFKKIIKKDDNLVCSVCAKGSILFSLVGRKNDYIYSDKKSLSSFDMCNSEGNHLSRLLDYFSAEQLDLLEVFFEGQTYSWTNYGHEFEDLAEDFRFENKDDTNRLVLLMQNIIDNNGTFVPEKL